MAWQKELELAQEAARAAGAQLGASMEDPQDVLSNAGRDVKLQADRDAESVIEEILAPSGYSQLAEEGGVTGDLEGDAAYWVVDPLDGTVNYSREIPICCVSIGLMKAGMPVLGVIYDFNRDEMFAGIVGEGATLNGKAVRVAGTTDKAQAILATGFPVYRSEDREAAQRYARHFTEYKKVRLIGSAALSMAYVACGRFDLYVDDNANLWDVAAGCALIVAAGGYTDLEPSHKKPWGRITRAAACRELLA